MKKRISLFLFLLLTLFILSSCTAAKKVVPKKTSEINVSAAISLKDVLEEIKKNYENKHTDVKLVLNFGSSGSLQKQVEQGSPTDLFISAAKEQMDTLEKKNLIKKNTRVDILTNDLVLITAKKDAIVAKFEDLTKPEVKNIGIGEPSSVPAGKYAQETLESMKLWDKVNSKLVKAKDVRQVLSYVESGNAEAGLVYKSDATVSKKVKVVAVAPKDAHEPIIYSAALIKSTKNSNGATKFLTYLQSDQATDLFQKYGFKKIRK